MNRVGYELLVSNVPHSIMLSCKNKMDKIEEALYGSVANLALVKFLFTEFI